MDGQITRRIQPVPVRRTNLLKLPTSLMHRRHHYFQYFHETFIRTPMSRAATRAAMRRLDFVRLTLVKTTTTRLVPGSALAGRVLLDALSAGTLPVRVVELLPVHRVGLNTHDDNNNNAANDPLHR